MSEYHCQICGVRYRFPFDSWDAVLASHSRNCKEDTE